MNKADILHDELFKIVKRKKRFYWIWTGYRSVREVVKKISKINRRTCDRVLRRF